MKRYFSFLFILLVNGVIIDNIYYQHIKKVYIIEKYRQLYYIEVLYAKNATGTNFDFFYKYTNKIN